jgi:predicted nucleotidyltransferase
MNDLYNRVLEASKIHPSRVKGCYVFGSRVYGTSSDNSDWDIILIANTSSYEVEVKSVDLNIHIITPDIALKYSKDNHIKAIECILAPEWAILKKFEFEFIYKEDSFRHNISHTVSNSWVKAKKKLDQGDYYLGIKSLFHSLRIANFGIQYATSGEIQFDKCNWIWQEINLADHIFTWEHLKERWQPIRNEYLTEFRKLVKKENV